MFDVVLVKDYNRPMGTVEAKDFRSGHADQVAQPLRDEAEAVRSLQTRFGKRFPILTPLGIKARKLDRQAETAWMREARIIDGFRSFTDSQEVRMLNSQILRNAEEIDESLRDVITHYLSLPGEERYLAFKHRMDPQKTFEFEDYMLNIVDAVSLALVLPPKHEVTVPISPTYRDHGIYLSKDAKMNAIIAHELLGIDIPSETILKPVHELDECYPSSLPNLTINFGFAYDKKTVLPEASNNIPYTTLTVSRNSQPAAETPKTTGESNDVAVLHPFPNEYFS